jgi:hypothetical protein
VDDPELDLARNKLSRNLFAEQGEEGFMSSVMGAVRSFTGGWFASDAEGSAPDADRSVVTGTKASNEANVLSSARPSVRGKTVPKSRNPTPTPAKKRNPAGLWLIFLAAGGALIAFGISRKAS